MHTHTHTHTGMHACMLELQCGMLQVVPWPPGKALDAYIVHNLIVAPDVVSSTPKVTHSILRLVLLLTRIPYTHVDDTCRLAHG